MIWTIAGSDPSAGAGLQADLKTASALGVRCGTVVTSVTAQNSRQFLRAAALAPELVVSQIESLKGDSAPQVIKIGMLHTRAIARAVAGELERLSAEIVCDPILCSSSGAPLIEEDAVSEIRRRLFPLVDVLTPNRPEAERLAGFELRSAADIERAALKILTAYGFTAVIIKGGHGTETFAHDYYLSANERFWLSSPRQPGAVARGTGCTFATALASRRAQGYEWSDAVVLAKAFLNQALDLRTDPAVLAYRPWTPEARLFPIASSAMRESAREAFRSCGPDALGFYPIVDRAEWLNRLLPLGVTTAQLRIKDLSGEELEREIARAIELARTSDCRLFINDFWRLAIRDGAYGAHLGQEDLADADLDEIRKAGLRLGISTHSELELARALEARPSYIALGPIYPTRLKAMRFAPQGLARLAEWSALCGEIPVVAIGGLTLERAPGAVAAGARSIAVVSDLTTSHEPENRARSWLEFSREAFR